MHGALCQKDVKSYAHLAKKGDPKEQAQKIFFDKDFGAYSEERRILQKIIDAISAETKQPPEEVWQDLANSYLRKEKFDTSERRALLEKVFHPGFVEKLGQVNTNDEETTKNLFNKDTPPKKNTIIDRWLNVYKRK
jgi:hypothetical protein